MVLKINSSHIVPAEISSGIVINLPELKLYYFSQGVYQRRFALAIGRRSWPTPTGEYKIRNKAKNPTWTVPASIQEEMAEMGQEVLESVPPGPENPLGSYWLGTSAPGVGLHATNRPWSVGHSVSHGCMRMLPEDIADLFPLVQVGDPVKITYQPVKMAQTSQGRIYLEAHPDVYGHKQDNRALVENLARVHQLQDHLDWPKIQEVLKTKDGIAHEVSKIPRQASSGTPLPCRAGPRVSLVSPLHPGQVEIE
jgi:L,D-transpeptidase ErfK/SrfK